MLLAKVGILFNYEILNYEALLICTYKYFIIYCWLWSFETKGSKM
jgi:hypothetical protein